MLQVYTSYGDASLRAKETIEPATTSNYDLYRLVPTIKLLSSLFLLAVHSFGVHMIIVMFLLASAITFLLGPTLLYANYCFLLFCALTLAIIYTIDRAETVTDTVSKPGLYFSRNIRNLKITERSPMLSQEYISPGSISSRFGLTPWVVGGDLATLAPFALNRPAAVPYHRFWVRVPLAHGPFSGLKISDDLADAKYEAVAVDSITVGNSSKSLLILAGLSGGSNEGYCLDIVRAATKQGWSCYVMLGRGLAGEPCLSSSLFHGARVSDAVATARVIKEIFKPEVLMAVGISLGGIIISNAMARDAFEGCIDAGVSISGACRMRRNVSYAHSRKGTA